MNFDNSEQVDALAKLPPEPPKPAERSIWSLVPRAIAGGAAKVGAATVDALDTVGDAAGKRKAFERQGLKAPETDLGTIATSARDFERDMRPDPVTAGTAEQLVYGAVSGLTAAGLGAVLGGAPGAAIGMGAAEGAATADDLRRQGVDPTTARTAGLVVGGVGAASVALPMAGPTLKATAGLYLAGGPAGYMAQQEAVSQILSGAGYAKIAEQYDPLDPVGLAVSALVPLPFAGYGAMRNVRAARAAEVPPVRDPVPGEPVKPAEPPKPAEPAPVPRAPETAPEVVDAAMVHNLTLQRDQAGKIQPAQNLDPIGRDIEQRFAAAVMRDPEGMLAEYAKLPDTAGGRIVNTDEARMLSPDYAATNDSRSLYAAAVHEPASYVARMQWQRLLAKPPETGRVLILGGGGGSGKTSSLEGIEPGFAKKFDAVYDTTLASKAKAIQTIEEALASGREVLINYTARDPLESIVNGIIPRAASKGRTVPLDIAAKAHEDAPKVLASLVDKYADDPRVKFRLIDNTKGAGQAAVVDVLPTFDYNGLRDRAMRAASDAYARQQITAAAYRGLTGENPAQATRGIRAGEGGPGSAGNGGQPEPQRGQVGTEATVVTERGLAVPVRYRLVEAGDLVTSHTNDLTANPAFPAELQPRDRTRAASSEQIARIEGQIRPELLGESVKASDGAPIIGPDAVVESGNARTIALRRAYESGKADGYRAWLEANAGRFGLQPEEVQGMRRPVLVRERIGQIDRAEFARQANESPIAALSPVEQARADAARMRDLSGLVPNDDGTINMAQSRDWVRGFMADIPPTERGAMMQSDGQLSQVGVQRIRNAVFAKAYGDPDILAALAESTSSNIKNILAGLLRAAPDVARLQDLIAAGAREPMDFAGDLVRAVRELGAMRERGMTVKDFLSQGDLLGDGLPASVNNLLIGLSENARSPKRVAEMVRMMVDAVDKLGDPRQASMFDAAGATKGDVSANAVERMRTLTDEQLAGSDVPAPKAGADALVQSVNDRMAALEVAAPDMVVRLDADGNPITLRDELARIRRESAEGTDTTLGGDDAPLVQVAANCALSMGA